MCDEGPHVRVHQSLAALADQTRGAVERLDDLGQQLDAVGHPDAGGDWIGRGAWLHLVSEVVRAWAASAKQAEALLPFAPAACAEPPIGEWPDALERVRA